MYPVRALRFGRLAFGTQVREIGCKHGGGDLDGPVEGHGRNPADFVST